MHQPAQGLLPASVEAIGTAQAQQAWAPRIAAAELSLLTRQLATLLESGLTIKQALTAMIEQTSAAVTRETLAGVKA